MYRACLVALAALLVFAPSCRKKEDQKKSTHQTTDMVDTTKPQHGGHLRLQSNEPVYLNPVLETRANNATSLIFEGLVGLDARLEPVKRLAEDWKISADKKTITFTLRKGVKFHDGKPFTSADVEFTFNAVRNTTEQTLWGAYMRNVESLETPDEHTVVVKYAQPYGPALTTWTMGIIPKHVYSDGDLVSSRGNTEPVGTGPYSLNQWESGKLMVLQANESYWFGRPYIDTIELAFDVADVIEELQAGRLHFANITEIEDWSNTAQLPEFRAKFAVAEVVESRFRVLAWNTQKAPFDNKMVRLAMTEALNRERIIDDVLLGNAQSLSAPFFPTMYGADPGIAPHRFNPVEANKLLDEAGFPVKDDKRFDLSIMALQSQRGSVADATLAIYRNDLRGLGITMNVEYLAYKDFAARAKSGEFDAAYFGWLPDIPDPDPYALLHSSQIGIGANYARYVNPEIDTLLEEARATPDKDERKRLYHKIHAVLNDELPYTMLYAPYGHYAWTTALRGVDPNDVGAQPRFPGLVRWWFATPSKASAKAASKAASNR